DRLDRLLVEDRLERRAAVRRLPHAATRRADVDGEPGALMDGIERRDAPTHRRRADVTRAQTRNRFRIHFRGGSLRRLLEKQEQEKVHGRAPGRANRVLSSGTLASILS